MIFVGQNCGLFLVSLVKLSQPDQQQPAALDAHKSFSRLGSDRAESAGGVDCKKIAASGNGC